MTYHYRKGTFERDIAFIAMMYITIACLVLSTGLVVRLYIAEGRNSNGICNVN